ncbi:uncharacterized protein PRCAT00005364001 [Priceomyces carsonii]|uniref:uncharacterized protein n=1 Tax=Priceomyces carsonii TaxID=28549 RepID=UPI002EDB502E|nr:unnamed protein product [Priceomyces carsonii]
MKVPRKLQEFIYSVSTSDKYSEFDSRKSFNRVNKADSERNLLYSHRMLSTGDFTGETDSNGHELNNNLDGVHEVKLAWRHVKNWGDRYCPDLMSSLQAKCTNDDLSDFQKDLNIQLPNCVHDFFRLTDGQSNYGFDTFQNGLIFGLKLMSLDEIMIETNNWRKVSKYLNNDLWNLKNSRANQLSKVSLSHYNNHGLLHFKNHQSDDGSNSSNSVDLGRSSRSSSVSSSQSFVTTTNAAPATAHGSEHPIRGTSGKNNIPRQRSIPPGTINDIFSHPMWIPLITDSVGNYIGLDLAPPEAGKWGQVILFGRDFDVKYKIADNWGDFLIMFANDLEIGNWDIKSSKKNGDGDIMIGSDGELVYMDKITKLEALYLEVLKKRCTKKWLESIASKSEQPEDIKQLIKQLNKPSDISQFEGVSSIDEYIKKNLVDVNNID